MKRQLSISRYDVYKDSGIEWLGEVPAHWAVGKLKDIAFYQEGPGIMADDFREEGVPLIRISGMKGATVSLDGCNFLDPIKVSRKWPYFKLKLGELLVSASATTGIAAKVSEAVVGAIPYTGLIRFKPRRKLCSDYLQYFLTANIFTCQIDLQKSGTTIQHYGPTHLGRVFSVLPPWPEQAAIAAYLDTKTAQIDRKIVLLSQKATQYGKLKQSLINETVTRGMDKTVAMKDSGVEWLGEIPAHWGLKRIKDLSFLQSGNTIVSEQIEEAGLYPVYGGNGLRGYFSKYTNNGGYILIGRQGALCGNINYASGKFWASEHAVVVYLNRFIDMKWYGEMLRVMNLNQYSVSAAQPGLAVDRIKRLVLPAPPFPEQQAIAAHLDEKTAHIDRIVATLNTQIDKLRELRKTLINDIVTGKICIVEQGGTGTSERG